MQTFSYSNIRRGCICSIWLMSFVFPAIVIASFWIEDAKVARQKWTGLLRRGVFRLLWTGLLRFKAAGSLATGVPRKPSERTCSVLRPIFTRMGHMTSGLGGLAPFFLPYFGHFWPPVNGFLPSPSGWDCSDFTKPNLVKCGINKYNACRWGYVKGYWRVAGTPIMHMAASNVNLRKAGYTFLYDEYVKWLP